MRAHLMQDRPEFESKYRVHRLGVPDRGIQVESSRDGVFRIVSCGRMDALKRYALLAEGLLALAQECPQQSIEWHHVGEGERQADIEGRLAAKALANLKWFIHANASDGYVVYREHPVDVFVHVSHSEGLPMVVMEALSCGVPVIAANAGGMADLVDSQVGELLPVELDAERLSEALGRVLASPTAWHAKRSAALKRWQAKACAESNYRVFATDIQELMAT